MSTKFRCFVYSTKLYGTEIVSVNLILLPIKDKILFKGRYRHNYWNIEFVKIYLEFISRHKFYNFEI